MVLQKKQWQRMERGQGWMVRGQDQGDLQEYLGLKKYGDEFYNINLIDDWQISSICSQYWPMKFKTSKTTITIASR